MVVEDVVGALYAFQPVGIAISEQSVIAGEVEDDCIRTVFVY